MLFVAAKLFRFGLTTSTDLTDLDFFTDQVQITGLDTPICNQPPDCDAGGPYAQECAAVVLDGTGSSDPEGYALTYSWTTDCAGDHLTTQIVQHQHLRCHHAI